MPKKYDKFSPKDIAKRMKSKGLQKLRWYCQMCQKQCRDDNGFKCHCMSEGHMRQMRLFGENPNKIIGGYSEQFKHSFVKLLSTRFGSKRVKANTVYQEYIRDKEHLHMNATCWTTLTGFIQFLSREGIATIDETERGWFIQYIDRSPEALEREKSLKRKRDDLEAEESHLQFIQKQVLAHQEAEGCAEAKEEEEVGDTASKVVITVDQPIKIMFEPPKKKQKIAHSLESSKPDAIITSEVPTLSKEPECGIPEAEPSKPAEAVEAAANSVGKPESKVMTETDRVYEMLKQEKAAKIQMLDKRNRRERWIVPRIVVKILNRRLAEGKYYKEKAVIESVEDYVGEVSVIASGDKLKLDQNDLETVLPSLGSQVFIVNGGGLDSIGKLISLNESDFTANVLIQEGELRGEIFPLDYGDICKMA